jgi:hypothetical protein
MERTSLEQWIDEGCSLEEMGRRADRHPSTISYWLRKHGLSAVRRDRHAPRGAPPREILECLVARDLSIRQIALEVDRSPSVVRYWLQRFGLSTTVRARRTGSSKAGRAAAVRVCRLHGAREHIADERGTLRCPRCRAEDVTRWRRRAKAILVAEAGGGCRICGYDRCVTALHFHHLDPASKRFAIGGRGLAQPLDRLREEAAKCVLLCANCHAEVEHGVLELPATMLLAPPTAGSVPG